MKVLIFFAVHRRIEILKVCLAGIARLKKYRSDIEISSLAVCSTKEEAKLCKANGCHVVITENEPLGRKKNTGLREALKLDFDYLMELGSDDLIHNSLLDLYLPLMRDGVDFFGVKRVMFYDSQTAKVARWENGFPIGAARCIKRSVIMQVKSKITVRITKPFANQYMLGIPGKEMVVSYQTARDLINSKFAEKVEQTEVLKLWDDDKMSGMDNNSMLNICGSGFKITTVPSEYWQVLDIKSAENINTFDWFDAVNYDVLHHYPHEAEMIKRL